MAHSHQPKFQLYLSRPVTSLPLCFKLNYGTIQAKDAIRPEDCIQVNNSVPCTP